MESNKSFIVVFLQLVQTLLAAITIIYIARILGAEEYGRYVYLLAMASVLSIFAGLGLEHVFIMEASKAPRLTSVYFGNALLVRTLLSLVSLSITASILLLLEIKDFWVVMLVAIGALLAMFPNPLFLSLYRVKSIYIKPYLISFTGPIAFLLYLLLLEGEFIRIEMVSLGFSLSHLLTLTFFFVDIKKLVKLKISFHYVKKYFNRGVIFAVSQGFDIAFARLDIFILQFVSGSYAVGIYAAGQKVVSLFQLIPSSFHIVELPEFHRVSGNSTLLTAKFRNMRKLLVEIGLFCFGLLSLNAIYIINLLFGAEYSDASIIVVLLSLSGFLLFLNYPYYMLAEAIDKIKQRMYIRIFTFFVTAVLMLGSIKFYGLVGAAIGLFSGQLFFLLLLHRLTLSHNGGFFAFIYDSRLLLIAVGTYAISVLVKFSLENEFIELLLGSSLYVILLLSFGHFLGWIEITRMVAKNFPWFKK